MAYLLSLCAALSFGAGDFFGGRAARRAPALSAVLLAQLVGLGLLVLTAPWTVPHLPDSSTVRWSLVAGLTGAIAALTLYPALALGSASEVAPLSAVIGTLLPIAFGLGLGERPSTSAWLGIVLAALTIVLVSADGGSGGLAPARRRRALLLAAVSGVFIGAFLIAFQRAGAGQGLLPLLVARASSVPLLALALALRRQPLWPGRAASASAMAAGVLDIAANGFYLFALARAPISVVATLSNLYPAFTVLLGVLVLHERPRPVQQLGLGLGLAAIVLITR